MPLKCCDYPTDDLCCECCFKGTDDCTGNLTKATIDLTKATIDLINRQQVKIEALQMDNEQLQSDVINANMNLEHIQAEKDNLRTKDLESMKLTVIRICNLDIDRNFRGVCEYIDLTAKNLSLSQLR